MACIATWSFGIQAVEVASAVVERGGNCVDAVEKGVNVVEDDPSTGRYYVGRGCYPNREGVVQLDAALMRGNDHAFGAVSALEGYAKPLSVARKVLEEPSLNMLVGNGARQFATHSGFILEDNDTLMTEETKAAYQKDMILCVSCVAYWHGLETCTSATVSNDPALLCLDQRGALAAGVSTSGPPFKHPGRVGDSPLPGCGLYADDKAGAAAASGDGEKIMQFCPSFHIVQQMCEGKCAQEACELVVRNMRQQSGEWFEIAVIALSPKGDFGAASTVKEWTDFKTQKKYPGFPYAMWRHGSQPKVYVHRSSD